MRVALAVLAAAVLAGAALAATGDPVKRHTAADMAKARSIVFTLRELGPGWTRDTSPDTDDDPRCSYFRIDESDLVETGYAESTFNHSSGATIGSEASIYKTVANAQTTWSRHVRPALARCLADEIRRQAVKDGDKAAIVSTGKLAFPRVSPRTAAFRLLVRLTPKGRTTAIPLTYDLVFLERGRILVFLGVITAGATPPASLDLPFAKLLDARMR
jgi:hypothetical protein